MLGIDVSTSSPTVYGSNLVTTLLVKLQYEFSGYESLSSDESKVAIGANLNDIENGTDAGHVRVYQLSNNVWLQLVEDIDGEGALGRSGSNASLSSDASRVTIGCGNTRVCANKTKLRAQPKGKNKLCESYTITPTGNTRHSSKEMTYIKKKLNWFIRKIVSKSNAIWKRL